MKIFSALTDAKWVETRPKDGAVEGEDKKKPNPAREIMKDRLKTVEPL